MPARCQTDRPALDPLPPHTPPPRGTTGPSRTRPARPRPARAHRRPRAAHAPAPPESDGTWNDITYFIDLTRTMTPTVEAEGEAEGEGAS